MKLNYDLLNNADRNTVARAAFSLLTRMQDHQGHIQIAAACAVFLLLCEKHKMPPEEVFRMATNVLAHDRKSQGEEYFGAVREYLKNELAA